jgi:hypothetical protein
VARAGGDSAPELGTEQKTVLERRADDACPPVRGKEEIVNRGIIGTIIGVLVIIVLVIVILQLT